MARLMRVCALHAGRRDRLRRRAAEFRNRHIDFAAKDFRRQHVAIPFQNAVAVDGRFAQHVKAAVQAGLRQFDAMAKLLDFFRRLDNPVR